MKTILKARASLLASILRLDSDEVESVINKRSLTVTDELADIINLADDYVDVMNGTCSPEDVLFGEEWIKDDIKASITLVHDDTQDLYTRALLAIHVLHFITRIEG